MLYGHVIHFQMRRKIPVDLRVYDYATIGYAIGVKTKNYEIFIS